MAGALRKTMVYLGLAEDDDRYDDDHRDDSAEAHDRGYDERSDRSERADRSDRSGARAESGAAVTQLPRRPASVARLVREPEVGPLNRITTIHPRTYNEAKTIGESFRDGTPVIMNLSDMGDADAKRLVDFAAGLVFGLHGTIERVTSKVFLLSPAHVEVSTEEPEGAPTARGFFNQS
ncbi:MAG: cell division protein SepF [Lapillicoccus sp.]